MHKYISFLIAFLGISMYAHAFTVVLDAGHGGHDAGAVGAFSKEKNINLRYALGVGDLIKKHHPDVKVIYTRNKDVFVNLNERARIANNAKADLFISIHTNAAKNRNANGMETFTLGVSRSKENMEVAMLENSVILLEDDYEKKYEGFDPNSTDSYIMFEFMKDQYMDRSISCAEMIQKNMIASSKRHNRGVRQAGFLVLRATTMPSVLIELGFISNREEEKFLNNAQNQAKICKAIYEAFAEYKHEIDKRNGKAEEEAVSDESQATGNNSGPSTSSGTEKSQATGNNSGPSTSSGTEKPQATGNNSGPSTGSGTEKPQATNDTTEYYWQILVSKNNYALNNPVFKGISIGNVVHDNQVYKYLVGPAYSAEAIEQERSKVKAQFPDAFIVVYQNGKRIAYQPNNQSKQ